jgi:hypothetical protein
MYDAVMLFEKTLQEFLALPVASTNETDDGTPFLISDETVPRCYDTNSWKFGYSIISHIKVVSDSMRTSVRELSYIPKLWSDSGAGVNVDCAHK